MLLAVQRIKRLAITLKGITIPRADLHSARCISALFFELAPSARRATSAVNRDGSDTIFDNIWLWLLRGLGAILGIGAEPMYGARGLIREFFQA